MFDPLLNPQEPFDARIDVVLALLNQRREFMRRGAENLFSRAEIAELLKLSGDPWTSALLAELTFARQRAEEIAAHTPYARVVTGLVGTARTRDASLRLMRRAVSRPIESAMLQAQDLLARIQADKMPLTAAASERLDSQLLALQQAWTQYSDRLLSAYLRLRESPASLMQEQPANPPLPTLPAPHATTQPLKQGELPREPQPRSPAEPGAVRWNRRRSDQEPTLH
ncbi:hypothetical protein [Paucibacter sp. Y2R2-4]|uniref:hypothetical protein n=1 Tax=Paucibacter sp. Y2R2-4 TaxID=2893553 RepID=UPI0021E4C280|nr:hypothetical protein [Paucibacter sp. Y2R2-4]MCV2350673.1 hypothetical protein [Paucibacter sp. Y2R2-4]